MTEPQCWLSIVAVLLGHAGFAVGPVPTAYPDIPRIDVHTHVADDYEAIDRYLELRDLLGEAYDVDFAFWINLSDRNRPIHDLEAVMTRSQNRSLACFGDYEPHQGLIYQPADLVKKREEGFVGYKIWYGTKSRRLQPGEKGYPYLDDPHNAPMLARMEELGVVAASMHIADPNGPFGNRTKWCPDPVEYWRMIRAFTRVMERHPDLVVVGAHGLWLLCQDAQIDYARYVLATYPNLYLDLAATYQYFGMVQHENLREFLIDYADRILFGTDAGRWHSEAETQTIAESYSRTFQILETDRVIERGFFGGDSIRGLNLPREVLEKIYFRNALKVYPGLKEKMVALEYKID